MVPYQLFGLLGLTLIILEVFIPGFVLLPTGVALLLTAAVGLLTDSWYVLLSFLAAMEVLVFVFVRKSLMKGFSSKNFLTNVESMVGQECEVIEAIRPNQSGYVKLYGDQWVARSTSEEEIPAGQRVRISRIDGNKVWVSQL